MKWNTSTLTWSKLSSSAGVDCVIAGATGVNGPIYAIDVDYSLCTSELQGVWVGGSFTEAGGGAAWNLAFWSAGSGTPYWDVPPSPTLSISPSGVVLPPGDVSITADFAASGCDISEVDFYEGNLLLASDATYPYGFEWNSVLPGNHTIVAIAKDANGRFGQSQPLAFTVDAAPGVLLTSPSDGASYTQPATISLAATAADSDGRIANVTFYANGTALHADTSSPYSYSWTGVAAGTYLITAVATDDNGATTTSSTATITVH